MNCSVIALEHALDRAIQRTRWNSKRMSIVIADKVASEFSTVANTAIYLTIQDVSSLTRQQEPTCHCIPAT